MPAAAPAEAATEPATDAATDTPSAVPTTVVTETARSRAVSTATGSISWSSCAGCGSREREVVGVTGESERGVAGCSERTERVMVVQVTDGIAWDGGYVRSLQAGPFSFETSPLNPEP